MKNDLSQFEKQLLKAINAKTGKSYDYNNLMEWGTRKDLLENNLEAGEVIHEVGVYFVAIKETKN